MTTAPEHTDAPMVDSSTDNANTGNQDPNANLIVNYIPNSMRDEQLRELFAKYGNIVSCRIIKDKLTQRSLGYGFVRFANAEEANAAIQELSGMKIEDKTLRVAVAKPQLDQNTNLYVAGLETHTTKEELEAIFRAYGNVTETKILVDRATNQSKGVGFVKFERQDEADAAVKALNGMTIVGSKPLTVRFAEKKDKKMPQLTAALAQRGGLRYNPMGMYGHMPAVGNMDPTWAYSAAAHGYGQQYPMGMYGQHIPAPQLPPAALGQTYGLFVYNLPPETDESYMYQLFGPYGAVAQVKVKRDPATNLCKGYGFVNMVKMEDAQQAIAALNGAQIGHKTLQVSFKRDKQQQ